MKIVVLLCCLAAYIQGSEANSGWSYRGGSGPSFWGNIAAFCNGRRQSPINIETASVTREAWAPFSFMNYDTAPRRMRVKNNGHSAQVEIDAAEAPRIDDGGLGGQYIFAQFHFHWGNDSSQGSEHTINGVRYPMELHLVHYKAEYIDIGTAIGKDDGLAVLGIMFEISQTDNPAFTPIVNALSQVAGAGLVIDVDGLYPLSAFLPRNREVFYRYLGSLTTPTCNEVVTWTLFDQAVPISENQMSAFRNMMFKSQDKLVNNYRPPQPLYNRKVQMSSPGSGSDASGMKSLGISMYFLSSLAVVMANM